jgi:Tfp pilus assembly protein PilF
MKKLLLMLAAFSGLAVYAQKSAVESAAIYLRNGEMEDAKKSIDAASQDDETKNDPKMWFYRAAVYDTLYRNPTAYAAIADPETVEKFAISCKKCLETDTKKRYEYYCGIAIINSAFASYNKAIEYMQAKDPKNAAKYFQYVLDVVPFDKDKNLQKNNINEKTILLSMADLGLKTQDYVAAKANLQKLINMDYQDPIVYLLMGNIWFTEKDTVKGMSYIDQGRSKFPTDKDLINTELNVYLAQGKQDVLLKKLNDALDLDGENVTLLFVRANVFDNYAAAAIKGGKNAKDTATTLGNKAKNATPANKPKLDAAAKTYTKLADSLFKMNKEYVTKAESDYKKVIEVKEDYVDAYFNLGALTNNKTTEIVDRMNALKAPTQAEYDKKWGVMKKEQDAILTVALGYFSKALEYAESLPDNEPAKKEYKNETLKSILLSMQQVYANLGDEKKTMETKKRRMELE